MRHQCKLQHEIVGDRTDAHDHHAQDVDRMRVLGVDCARRAAQAGRNNSRSCGDSACPRSGLALRIARRLWQYARLGNLPLALRQTMESTVTLITRPG